MMDSIQYALPFINALVLLTVGLVLKNYLPAYMKEKAKNQATKEDIELITSMVEGIKSSNQKEIEKLKLSLSLEDKLLEKRREIYEEIVSALRLFISGHSATSDIKDKFHSSYASAWLWAPDNVLSSLNVFVDSQVKMASGSTQITQEEAKRLYAKVILEMRKDVGFVDTKETIHNYRFVKFGN